LADDDLGCLDPGAQPDSFDLDIERASTNRRRSLRNTCTIGHNHGVDVDEPERDQQWDRAVRSETETERLDRNWASLLQEMRVVQTGVQLLTGFLLTLPFQQRFDRLDGPMRIVYLVTVGCAIASTLCLVAPVAMHRMLFRQRRVKSLVSASHRLTFLGLTLLGAALVGVTVVTFAVVLDAMAGWIAGVCTAVAVTLTWLGFPLMARHLGDGPSTRRGNCR
jgi:hypothetical protein